MHPFELGAFFFGGVEMDDAGAGPPAPMDRRFTNEQMWKATTDYVELGDRGRAPRLRLVLDDRAPLPARGLRGRPERHPAVDVDRRPHAAASASARCSTSSRSGTRCAWPRTSRRCTTCRAAAASSASAAARCPARSCTSTTRACRSAPTTTPTRPPTTTATGGSSRSRWRSSGWRSPRSRSPTTASSSSCRCPASPTAAAPCSTLTLVPRPLYPYEIWQAVTSPPTLRVRPGRRPRRGVLEPAPLVHQALLGHLRRALRGRPRRPRARRPREADARHRGAHRGHPREGDRDGDARPRRVLEVPRPVRLEPRLHGRGRQAGASRADPDARPSRSRTRRSSSARPRRSPRASPSTATCSACGT